VLYYDEDKFVGIKIFDWKDDNRVEVEVHYGGYNSFDEEFKTVKDARDFISKLQLATKNIEKYKVDEEGICEKCV
jgi:hypothetical protein